jgi:hypothetical protein
MAAFAATIQQPVRPIASHSSASELAAARAYDHFHHPMPNTLQSADSGERHGLLEGYTVWSPHDSRTRRGVRSRSPRAPRLSAPVSMGSMDADVASPLTPDSAYAEPRSHPAGVREDGDGAAIDRMGSGSLTRRDSQQFYGSADGAGELADVFGPLMGADSDRERDPRLYESEPLLVGALVDRAQWWDDQSSDGEGQERRDSDGGGAGFCSMDMISRMWVGRSADGGDSADGAADVEGVGVGVDDGGDGMGAGHAAAAEGRDLADFDGGMEGDIMQAAANATASIDTHDKEEVGYLEQLRQRVLAMSTVRPSPSRADAYGTRQARAVPARLQAGGAPVARWRHLRGIHRW